MKAGKISTLINEGMWYKGNTHLHTTLSDGTVTPEAAVTLYREAGYSFLAVTDHKKYGIHGHLQTDDFIIFSGTELETPLPKESVEKNNIMIYLNTAKN